MQHALAFLNATAHSHQTIPSHHPEKPRKLSVLPSGKRLMLPLPLLLALLLDIQACQWQKVFGQEPPTVPFDSIAINSVSC